MAQDTNYGGKQPRIDRAEREKNANKPPKIAKKDEHKHPGSGK